MDKKDVKIIKETLFSIKKVMVDIIVMIERLQEFIVKNGKQ